MEKGQGARDGRVGKTGPIIDCLIHKMTTCRGNRVACVRFLYPDHTFCTHICLHLNRSNLPKLSGGNENIIISTQLKIIVARLRYMGRIVVALLLASLSPKCSWQWVSVVLFVPVIFGQFPFTIFSINSLECLLYFALVFH